MALGGTNAQIKTMTSAGDILSGKYFVEGFRWIGTTAGDDLVVDDKNGNVIWQSKAETNNFTDSITFSHIVFEDITIDTIDSGTLYVYTK